MYTLKFLAPILLSMCAEEFISGQGDYCVIDRGQPNVIKYEKQNPEDACYKDGIFYPRCKDLENPQVLYYHNLLYAND